MTLGKSISLFLLDGTPESRIVAELFNWTGKAYKLPRVLLSASAKRTELYKAGVYFLLGRDDVDPDKLLVYIGEAEEVYKRLLQHDKDPNRDYWHEAIVFVSKDSNLNKAHIKYLEFTAYSALREAKRAEIKNGNTPPAPAISEADEAVIGEFFGNMKLLVGALGYRIFEPLERSSSSPKPVQPGQAAAADLLFITKGTGTTSAVIATGTVTNDGFAVQKGSLVQADKAGIPEYAQKLRSRLVEDKVIEKTQGDGEYRFTEAHLFSSPSTAATIVLGTSANGRIAWKDATGQSINDITARQLAQASAQVSNPSDDLSTTSATHQNDDSG